MDTTIPNKASASMMRLDPITFEVLRNSFVTLVDEMGHRLFRASFSPAVNQARDYSIAMFDPQGEFVTAGHWDMPIHYGTFPFSIREVIRVFGLDNIFEGDIYLYNDPYKGGTHNQDMKAIRPIFFEGELVAWLVAMAHWTDVGGPVPGTFNSEASDSYSEGVRITPIKIYERGVRIEPVIQFLLANVRVPHERNGDLHAQVQTCLLGEERLLDLFRKYGKATIHEAFADMWDYSERMLLSQTIHLPNGGYEWTDFVDQDTVHPDKPPVKIHLRLVIKDGHLTFDFTGSDPAPMGPVGSSLPATYSGVLLTVLNLFPGIPYNAGAQRLIEITTVPDSVVHVRPPTPCSGFAAGTLEKLIDCIIGAMGLASPNLQAGARYNLVNVTVGGWDERFNREYVMYVWEPGGLGGTARGDLPYATHCIFGPGIRTQPTEVLERFFPVLFTRASIRENSAGPGKHRGGFGTDFRFQLTHGRSLLGVMGDRKRFPPRGVAGGRDALPQDLFIDRGGENEVVVGMFAANVPVPQGSEVQILTTGGGGWGDPLQRDPQLVLEDVRNGLVSLEAAADGYGVNIREINADLFEYEIDADATARARDALRRGATLTVATTTGQPEISHERSVRP